MNPDELDLEQLRRALLEPADGEPEESRKATAGRIWDAARGKLPPDETRQLADRTLDDPTDALAWRLAREVDTTVLEDTVPAEDVTPGEDGHRGGRRWPLQRWMQVAAVLAGLILLPLVLLQRSGDPPAQIRQGSDALTLESLSLETCPRDDCTLRWSAPAEGLRYHLRVTTDDLRPLLDRRQLETREFRLPVAELAYLPAGSTLSWSVETRLPDGTLLHSETFLITLD